tara:strand:- start:21657 stop:21953 length:297 start_codon:yes stop_codon:yes gene_type:complete
MTYKLSFLDWFDDRKEEVEQKGWHTVKVEINDYVVEFEVYDQVRLMQDIAINVERAGYFTEERLIIVVTNVTRKNIEKAIENIMQYPKYKELGSMGFE